MSALFLATANAHKVDEFRQLLGARHLVLSFRDTSARIDVPETADTFGGNALLKAVAWARYLSIDACNLGVEWVVADDSGLEVDALGGAPGVHSARFAALRGGAKGNSADVDNNALLLRLMADVPEGRRTARFRCVLAVVPVSDPNPGAAVYFFGACEGRLLGLGAGAHGFGYDPLFVPEGETRSFAELGMEEKGRMSHRARAVAGLARWLGERGAGMGD